MKQVALITGFWLMLVACLPALAGNIDLSTVPARDSVQLTIYNGEDLTLVRETRKITFQKGANPLQFSWANTLIDPTSVELRFLNNAEKLEVLDTTFPRDKPQMLYWNVNSDFAGEATVEITYFTSGITWSADYVCTASKDESRVGLDGFVRVTNQSGEEYENAQVRLVVGTINLVEKIAHLAQANRLQAGVDKDALRHRALKTELDDVDGTNGPVTATQPMSSVAPKRIIKEGLSEYFIYTIEGTETIPDGWSKRLRSIEAADVPLKIQYRFRPQEYGEQLVRMYLLTNDKDSKLGTTPLPDGVVRVFRDNGRDGLAYLASQKIKYIPIGDKIELNLGEDPQVIFELVKLNVWRDNIWMQLNGANVLRRIDDGAGRIQANSSVAGWDEHQLFTQRIRNYSPRAIDVEIRRSFDGNVSFRSALNPTLHDYRTAQFQASVDAGQTSNQYFETVTRQGHNAKQNNIRLQSADAKPR